MNVFDDVRNAKRIRQSLPWERGLAGIVLNTRTASQFPLTGIDMFTKGWSVDFLRKASVVDYSFTAARSVGAPVVSQVHAATATGTVPEDSLKVVGRRRVQLPWPKQAVDERHIALERWRLIIEMNPQGTLVGRQLQSVLDGTSVGVTAEAIVIDTFKGKAEATLNQRSGSLMLYGNWLLSFGLLETIFPLKEFLVYKYLRSLQDDKAPATRASRFREAVSFSFGVLGADGCSDVMGSRRCHGAALGSSETKCRHSQRDPWTVQQALAFEEGVFILPSEHDRIMSGNAAALLNLRARFSDVANCVDEPQLDVSTIESYFEISVMDTKVSRKDKRRKVLPLIGSAVGISGRPWVAEWLALRKKHGLRAKEGPLFTAVRSSGEWTECRLRSSEAAVWFRLILDKVDTIRQETSKDSLPCKVLATQKTGTHCCKITYLSWASKAGMSVVDSTMLGYHTTGISATALLYSRAAWAGPMTLQALMPH